MQKHINPNAAIPIIKLQQCCTLSRHWDDLPPFWLSHLLSSLEGAAYAPWKFKHLYWIECKLPFLNKLPPHTRGTVRTPHFQILDASLSDGFIIIMGIHTPGKMIFELKQIPGIFEQSLDPSQYKDVILPV